MEKKDSDCMFSLREAMIDDIQLLIKYKLSTIFQFAEDITEIEEKQIMDYVNENVPKMLNDYKIVVVNGDDKGCLLVTNYDDGKMIDEIYLEEECRNKGIGTKLIRSVLNKHSVVYLWVYKKNEKAIKLYEKLGFKEKHSTETRYLMKYEK